MTEGADRRHPVDLVAEEFLTRYRQGERPAVDEYQQRYPDLASQIAELFPALVWMEQVADGGAGPLSTGEAPWDSPPTERLGDFRIVREIGRGGMGVVYEAEQESLGRKVAVKVLPRQLLADKRLALRFEREARAAARLHHTNIVPVFGVGHQEGLHYYVMQFIHGQGLDQVLEELRRLRSAEGRAARGTASEGSTPPPQSCPTNGSACQVAQSLFCGHFAPHEAAVACAADVAEDPSSATSPESGADQEPAPAPAETSGSSGSFALPGQSDTGSGNSPRSAYWLSVARIGIQAALALQYAHDEGIVHRDVKPANLLLDLHGTVWVTDFGLAKATHQGELTQTGDVLGTLRYMAPEQFEGRSDVRADVYSLGLTLYELLALKPAFDERDRPRLIRQVTTGTAVRLRAHDPNIPRDLETIVHKAIEREPEHRYPSAQAMADDLKRFERGEPIRARSLAAWEKVWKWCRRSPGLAGLSAAVLLLLLTVTTGSLVAARVYQGQRNSLKQSVIRLADATSQLTMERDRALRAEAAERSKRAEALFDQARMGRFSGQLGRRFHGLAAIEEAVGIERSQEAHMDPLDPRLVIRRSEAIACLALPDFQVLRSYPVDRTELHHMHAQSGLRAQSPNHRTVQLYLHDRALGEVETEVADATITQLAISPDGELVAAGFGGTSCGVCIWNGLTRELLGRHTLPNAPGWLGFGGEGRLLGAVDSSGGVSIMPAGHEGLPKTVATVPNVVHAAFSPDEREFAVAAEEGVILVLDTASGQISRRLSLGIRPMSVDWSRDGSRLAIGGYHGNVQIVNSRSAAPIADLGGHKHATHNIYYHPSGDYIATSSWDGTTRLWSIPMRKEVLRTSGWIVGPGFDPQGLRLSFVTASEIGVWEVNLAPECRILAGHAPGTTVLGSTFHPESRLLGTWGYDGVRLWDAVAGKELAWLDIGASEGAAFDRQGNLVTTSSLGQIQWPISWPSGNRTVVHVGPPEPVDVGNPNHYLTIATAADRLAQIVDHRGRVAVRDLASRQGSTLEREGDLSAIDISSSGKWVAGTPQHSEGLTVWNAATGDVIRQLPTAGWAACAFSPAEQWLVVSDTREIRFWRTSDWMVSHGVPSPGTGCVTFSPDGRLVATGKYLASGGANAVQLVDVASGRLVATLENTPAPTQIERYLRFSPDGRYLAVPHYSDSVFSLWDLAAIRGRLSALGLDWDGAAPANPRPAASPPPLRVQVRLEPLAAIRHLRAAKQLLVAKKYAEVISEADAGLQLAPEYPDLWYLRGRGRAGLKEFDLAAADYTQAIQLQPRHSEAYHFRAHARGSLQHFAEALADFETACRHKADDSHLLDHVGDYQRHVGNFSQSATTLRKSLSLKAAPKTQHELARLLLVGPEDLRNVTEALALAEAAVKANTQQATWLATLGMAYYRLERFEKATEMLDRSAAAYPGTSPMPPVERFFQALAWSKRGDAAKAGELYKRALSDTGELKSLSPGDRTLLDMIATEAKAAIQPQ